MNGRLRAGRWRAWPGSVLASLVGRWAWVGTAVAAKGRFDELRGAALAGAVSLAAFVSLFPLVLVGVGIVGLVAAGGGELSGAVTERLGITDEATAELLRSALATAAASGRTASVLGLVGLVWSGLGVVAAVQTTFDAVWQAPRRGIRARMYGLGWLVGAGALFVASFAVAALVGRLPGPAWPLALAANLAVGVVLWLWSFMALTNHAVGWRALVPGAVLGAVGLQALQLVGGVWVPHLVASSSALYGSIGVVFAALAWLVVLGRLVVYAAVLNVVRWEQDHGTVTAEIELPRVAGTTPASATRSGAAHH